MSDDAGHTRRWLINASGAAIVSGAIPVAAAGAQTASAASARAHGAEESVSAATATLADYVAKTLDRELPAEVIVRTKLHVLDTFAAILSGSRLKPGELAARYVDSLGGKPQATVIGTGIVTSPVNAALANAMSAHADANELMRWLSGIVQVPKMTYLVHGEATALRALAERIARERSWPVHIAQHLERVELDLG
jgi:Cft2 family RNA processing exonuclease